MGERTGVVDSEMGPNLSRDILTPSALQKCRLLPILIHFLLLTTQGTHRHAAALNEGRLDVYRDDEVQPAEEKLKLRCPNHHKVSHAVNCI